MHARPTDTLSLTYSPTATLSEMFEGGGARVCQGEKRDMWMAVYAARLSAISGKFTSVKCWQVPNLCGEGRAASPFC